MPVRNTFTLNGDWHSSGEYVAAICLNMDISMLAAAAASVQQLVNVPNHAPAPVRETLSNRRLDDIAPLIADFAAQRNTTPQGLSLAQRRDAIRLIEARGLLDLRHAHAEVARDAPNGILSVPDDDRQHRDGPQPVQRR